MCKGKSPARPGGRSMHGLLKPQACAALAAFDGYCPIHLKARGYSRCPTCGAWRQPAGHRGLSMPICDVCSSMSGPAVPPLPLVGNLVEEGLSGLDREDDPPLDARALGDQELRRKA
jgi:hypothetical protein